MRNKKQDIIKCDSNVNKTMTFFIIAVQSIQMHIRHIAWKTEMWIL